MLMIKMFVGHNHLHTDGFETYTFKALDDFADNSPLDGVRLQDH